MNLTIEDITKIAQLARLHFPPEKLATLEHDFQEILRLFELLQVCHEAEQVEPLANVLEQTQRLSIDHFLPFQQQEDVQKIAPSLTGSLYLVPQVIHSTEEYSP